MIDLEEELKNQREYLGEAIKEEENSALLSVGLENIALGLTQIAKVFGEGLIEEAKKRTQSHQERINYLEEQIEQEENEK